MTQQPPPKLGPDPSADIIKTGRTLKRLFLGEMTFADLLRPEGRIQKQCTICPGCTEPDGHDGGCCFPAEGV